MLSNHQTPIKELFQDPNIDIRKIFTHPDIIFIMKNQDPIMKSIFTEGNIQILLSYLIKEHPLESNNVQLCYMMPQMAMQILCCQSHLISQMIFQSQKQPQQNKSQTEGLDVDKVVNRQENKQKDNLSTNKKHLLDKLFSFLDYQQQHYFLASYFSKVVGSLTKRVFAPSHKYNPIICKKIFIQSPQNKVPILFKTLNHIYSQSMNQLIIRWLTLKSKQTSFQSIKQKFIEIFLRLINQEQDSDLSLCQVVLGEGQQQSFKLINFSQQSLQSIISLIMLLLKSPLQPPPQRPQQVQHKNINLLINKNAQKQLYELICKQKYILEILKPIPNPRIQKLVLMRKILQQYRVEKEQMIKLDEPYNDRFLGEVVNQSMLVEGLGWVNQVLMVLSEGIDYSGRLGQDLTQIQRQSQNQPQNSTNKNKNPTKNSQINKKYLIAYLQLLYQFHLLHEQLQEPLTYHYEQNQKHHILIILKFLSLKNNLIQNLLTKIINIVLRKLNCTDFATALLHHGISSVIDEEGIRQHVLQWAKIIMENQGEKGHVYQNAQEEARWDHMGQVVAAAEDIVIGKFRFRPANLDCFYSAEKAKDHYAAFLGQPIQIQYGQKLIMKKVQSQQNATIKKQQLPEQISLQKRQSGPAAINTSSQLQRKQEIIVVVDQQKSQPSPQITQPKNLQEKTKPQITIPNQFQSQSQPKCSQNQTKQSQPQQPQTKPQALPSAIAPGQEQPIDDLDVDGIRQGYLQYDVDKLLAEVQCNNEEQVEILKQQLTQQLTQNLQQKQKQKQKEQSSSLNNN